MTAAKLNGWTAEFARFARDTAQTRELSETVRRIADQARRSLGADHAGVVLVRSGRTLASAGATDPVAQQADQLQYELVEGPCIGVAGGSHFMYSPDVSVDERWPRWGPRAATLGVRSMLSAGLYTATRRFGALTLYATRPGRFNTEDAAIADLFAAHAAAALAAATESESLQSAVATRTVIGQAQGILMARYGLGAEQAFAVLRRYSQDTDQKLYHVAGRVIENHDLPDREAPADPRVIHAAHLARIRAVELGRRVAALQAGIKVTPGHVASAELAAEAARKRAAAASERAAERRLRAGAPPDPAGELAAVHEQIAALYRRLAELDPARRADHESAAQGHAAASRHAVKNRDVTS